MLPARFAPVLFGFLLSGIMSGIVTLVAAVRNVGLAIQAVDAWLNAWLFGWPVAFCGIMVVAPVVRGFVNRLVKQGT
ncbi:DUF2798 domain-containing protein [Phaeobacter sp. QD34_3]|jgi:hypothetical protein|uniref:DUF2798 domain-containing protein n=1 Tax=unclassified Phaeobacter TaxID=2621772 RepID=UPI00237F960F|nr:MULTISPECIES: DUF2798 domain-containing protein [unclassified Phaeobacter]MDE4133172.1 DUF2798 domain-containing protein [Phaeobacter sp. QD34_3]MDE4136758.1 DUF2798 domain-containing protein [Phaeobacter sp. QD34_24]MDE4173065.1 DUF2798 domain-containing protein [Phaeobacter sp. PT47_59]